MTIDEFGWQPGSERDGPGSVPDENINMAIWSQEPIISNFSDKMGTLDRGEETVLCRVAQDVRNRPILDLGVGGGRTVPILCLLSEDYIGVDYTQAMVDLCRTRYPERSFRHLDARDLAVLPSAHFHLVFFSFNGIDTVGHDDRLGIIAEVRRVVAPGGYFVFNSHNYDGPDLWNRPWHLRPTPTVSAVGLRRTASHAIRQVISLPKNLANYRRLARLSVDDGRYAFASNPAHNYGLLMYYGARGHTAALLKRFGFDTVEVFTNSGEPVDDGSDVRSHPWLYYVARVTARVEHDD